MKHYLYIIFLLFSLGLAGTKVFAQEGAPTEQSTPEEQQGETTETTTDATPSKPTRLPNNTPRAQFPAKENNTMQLLAKQLPKDAFLWLEAESGQFLGIWQKDRSGYSKGALLIVHAEGEHPMWPHTTKPLHDTLPDYGWATLAISLPKPDLPSPPQRTLAVKSKLQAQAAGSESSQPQTDAGDIDEEKTGEDTIENEKAVAEKPSATLETRVPKVSSEIIAEQRLEAALRFLHDQGQFNLILLGNGSGAIRIHDFLEKVTPKISNPKLKERFEKPVRAMIILNGRNQLPIEEDAYQGWFNDPEIPVLDIFIANDYRNQKEAKIRKTLAKQKKVTAYKQVRMTAINHEKSWGENKLSRRIRSFLDSNAVGVEVQNAKHAK